MSDLTPSKLKVVELRAELQSRGLEVKGNKAVLVQRLEEALKKEEAEGEEEFEENSNESGESEPEEPATQNKEESPPAKSAKKVDEKPKESIDSKPVVESKSVDSIKKVEPDITLADAHQPEIKPPTTTPKSPSGRNVSTDRVQTSSSPVSTPHIAKSPVIEPKPAASSPTLKPETATPVKPTPGVTPTKPVSDTTPIKPVPGTTPIKTDSLAKPGPASKVKSPISSFIKSDPTTPAITPEPSSSVKAATTIPVESPLNLPTKSPTDTSVETPASGVPTSQPNTPLKPEENFGIKTEPAEEPNQEMNKDASESPMDVSAVESIKREPGENSLKRKRSTSPSSTPMLEPKVQKPVRKDAAIENRKFENTDELEKIGTVVLDPYNSDLNLIIDDTGFVAEPLYRDGFAFMWAGARSTHGITSGKICFEVKLVVHLAAQLPEDEVNPHVLRIGFSTDDATMHLGEEPLSYGFGGTGKASTNCKFRDYGQPFVEGDVVAGYLDMSAAHVQISFSKNGQHLGVAYNLSKSELNGAAMFPHILTKNVAFEVNFGQREEPYFKNPKGYEDFEFINNVPLENRLRGSLPPSKKTDCEMIMMCGLPGVGKTTWALEFSKKNPQKKYYILGTNNIIDQMRVMGLPRKRNYSGRWDALIQMSTRCLNKLFEIACKARRNYILDQTNVYPSAQRRKLRNFQEFKRTAVVIVPTEDEFQNRVMKREREEGKDVPDSAVLEMKANFGIPQDNDLFDEVLFPELGRPEAQALVQQYNTEGRAVVGNPHKRQRLSDTSPLASWGKSPQSQVPSDRGHDRRNSPEQWSRDRNSGGGGYNQRGGYQNRNSPGGYQNRDSPGGYQNRGGSSGYQQRESPRGGGGYQSPRGGRYNQQGGSGGYNRGGGGSGSRDNSRGGYGRGGGGANRDRNFQGGGGGGRGNRGSYSGGSGGGGYNRDSSGGFRGSSSGRGGGGGSYGGGNKSQSSSYGNQNNNWNQQQQGYGSQTSSQRGGYSQPQQAYGQQQQQQSYQNYGQQQAGGYGQQTGAAAQFGQSGYQQQATAQPPPQQQQQQQYGNQWAQQGTNYQGYYGSGYQQTQ